MTIFFKIAIFTTTLALLFGVTFFLFNPLVTTDNDKITIQFSPSPIVNILSPALAESPGSTRLSLGIIENEFFSTSSNNKIIRINLDEKTLEFFENGVILKSLPVLSIGKEGSPWQTPAGEYR